MYTRGTRARESRASDPALPDMLLDICTDDTSVMAGGTVEYMVYMENIGAPSVFIFPLELFITLPEDMSFVESDEDPLWIVDNIVKWEFSVPNTGDSITFCFQVSTSPLLQEGDVLIVTAFFRLCINIEDVIYLEWYADANDIQIVSAPPSGELMSVGFWKHQVLAILYGKGRNQIPVDYMMFYLDMIGSSTDIFDLDHSGAFSLEEARQVLINRKGSDMRDHALRQFLGVYFNIMNRGVSMETGIDVILSGNEGLEVYADSLLTVGDAVEFAEDVIESSSSDLYELVKDLCEDINRGTIIIW